MSPLAMWEARYRFEDVQVPCEPDELEIICCASCTRTISHIGIELDSCQFNSPALQALWRTVPTRNRVVVSVRFNEASMARIWVKDPVTGTYVAVDNPDPITRRMSSAQVKELERHRRLNQPPGVITSKVEALGRMKATYQPLLRAKTQAARRKAFKMLGMTLIDREDVVNRRIAKAPKPRQPQTRSMLDVPVWDAPQNARPQHHTAALDDQVPSYGPLLPAAFQPSTHGGAA